MTLLVLLIVTITAGFQAQAIKGRTGALWGFLTFLAGALWWGFLSFAIGQHPQSVADLDDHSLSVMMALLVNVPVWALMTAIIATLPKVRAP